MSFQSNCNSKYIRSFLALGIALVLPIMSTSNAIATSKSQQNKVFIKEKNIKESSLNNAIAATPRVSRTTLNLVKKYEGFRSSAYMDTNGLPVIGYGQSKINGKRVKMGQYISRTKADAELERELYHIQRLVLSKVRVRLTPNQLGALTSLVYNAGSRILTNSTLIRKLNVGDYAGAAREFPRWNKAHQGGRLVPFPGLTKRRLAEQRLFLTP